MNEYSKIKNIISLSKISPVLIIGVPSEAFENSTILNGDISSKELGIVNTANGLKSPNWLYSIVKEKGSRQIIIENIDDEDKENQEKFYELLKYKTISNVKLPKDCNIIVTAKDLKNVSETIIRLCQIVK